MTSIGRAQVHSVTIRTDDGWTYHSAINNGQVVGFLASRDPATVPAHTFSTIWFKRQPNGVFSWQGWSGQSVAAAAAQVETDESHPGLFTDASLQSNAGTPEVIANAGFVAMQNGLAEDDLFQPVATLFTPGQMEAVVELVAGGAVSLSASQVLQATNTCGGPADPEAPGSNQGAASSTLMQARLEAGAAKVERILSLSDDDNNLPSPIFCFPGWYNVTTSVTRTCGPGVPAGTAGLCSYSCTTTTTGFTVWVGCTCVAGVPVPYTRVSPPFTIYKTANADGTCP